MIHLSLWARHHIWTARFIIFFSWIILGAIALSWGLLAYWSELSFSPFWSYMISTIIGGAILFYPTAGTTNLDRYIRQKYCDVIMISGTILLLIMSVCNYCATLLPHQLTPQARFMVHKDSKVKKKKPSRQYRKELKKELRTCLKQSKVDIIKNRGDIALFVILTLLLGTVLLVLLASFACSLSCSGTPIVSILFIIGFLLTIVVFGFIGLYKLIVKKPRERRRLKYQKELEKLSHQKA